MALTRKFLTALGIEPEKVDEIISAHSESVDALKEQISEYKAGAEKLSEVEKELDSLKAAKGDDDEYKAKYDKEHADFEAYKKEQTAKEEKAHKTEAYRKLLKEAGISEKHLDAVLKVSDVDSLEFDDEGKIKDSDKKLETIKKDWEDFIVKDEKKGAETKTPPETDGKGSEATGAARKMWEEYRSSHYGAVPQSNQMTNDNNGGNK